MLAQQHRAAGPEPADELLEVEPVGGVGLVDGVVAVGRGVEHRGDVVGDAQLLAQRRTAERRVGGAEHVVAGVARLETGPA